MADRQVDRGLRERGVSAPADVAIIGGGIVGCAAAAFLAEAGVRVDLYEGEEVAAAASGRNSGSVQHPFDPVLRDLHLETLRHYRELADFELPDEPVGVLMLARERAVLEPSVTEVARDCPELVPALLEPDELRTVEPAVRPGLWGCRLETGYPVRPGRGHPRVRQARLRRRRPLPRGRDRLAVGDRGARPRRACRRGAAPGRGRARGRGALDAGGDRPHSRLAADRAGLGSGGRDRDGGPAAARARGGGGGGRGRRRGGVDLQPGGGATGRSSVGSTFLAEQPDAPPWAPTLRRAGERFVPGLRRAKVVGVRACARPQSVDGRPLVGEIPGLEGLWVAAGHGPVGHLHRSRPRPGSWWTLCSARPRCRRRCRSRAPRSPPPARGRAGRSRCRPP